MVTALRGHERLRQEVSAFMETYNNEWLIERLTTTPHEAFIEATAQVAA